MVIVGYVNKMEYSINFFAIFGVKLFVMLILYVVQDVPEMSDGVFWFMLLFIAIIIWLFVKIVDHWIDRWKK